VFTWKWEAGYRSGMERVLADGELGNNLVDADSLPPDWNRTTAQSSEMSTVQGNLLHNYVLIVCASNCPSDLAFLNSIRLM